MEKLYHATLKENLISIYDNGIKRGWDGLVYTCDNPNDALKFLALRAMAENKEVVVIEIFTKYLNESKLQDGMDHNPSFFGNPVVKTYPEDIPTKALGQYFEAERRKSK